MRIVPPEVIALLFAAVVSRLLNRSPPLVERLLRGLRFYDTPYKSDVERVLEASASTSGITRQDATLLQQALDAVSVRGRVITYSHFPYTTVPWSSMVARDALGAVVVTGVYASIALVFISMMVCGETWRPSPPRNMLSCAHRRVTY